MTIVFPPRSINVSLIILVLIITSGTRGQAQGSSGAHRSGLNQSQETTRRLSAEGVAAFKQGDLLTAQTLFERVLVSDPQNIAAHTHLGMLADRAGDLKSAEHHLAIVARLTPKSASSRNNYGAILLRLGRTKEAVSEFEAALRINPKQVNALMNFAQIRFARGTAEELSAARELFRRADVVAPEVATARALTVIALRQSDYGQAADYYRMYARRLANSSDASLNTNTRTELGGALLEAGLLAEAEAELKASLSLAPTDVEAILFLARVYLARKETMTAGRVLESAVAHKIEAAPIYALLASVYEQSGHFENAIPTMRLAIRLNPQSEKYRFQYAILLTNSKAPAAALIRLNEALELFPKSALVWLGLGIANFKLGRYEEAARAFNRAIELDLKLAQGYAYLGLTYAGMGQYDDAVNSYQQALERDPKLGIVHYLIADVMFKKPDAALENIERHLRKAIQMEPNYSPSRVALAKVYMRTDRLIEAATELERAVKIDLNLAEAYYQLSRVYGRLKRTAEMQTALTTFKRLSNLQEQQQLDEHLAITRRLAEVRF